VLEVTLISLLFVLALVLLIVAIFPIPCRLSLLAAGLASGMLGYIVATGVIPASPATILIGVAVLLAVCWLVAFPRPPATPPAP
jgi:hypothetical protein